MRQIILAAAALAVAPFVALAQGGPTDEQMTRIDAVLEARSCEVGPANVEVKADGFDLDDVMCASGQYDIRLDASFAVTEERKE